MATHSTVIGGSTATQRIACHASFQATVALPPSVQTSSEYADEGTAMHEVMERLGRARKDNHHYNTAAKLQLLARQWIGEKFHDRFLTPEHVDEMIAPAIASWIDLEEEYGGGFKVIAVEKHARFPGVIGAFGTIDLVLQSKKWVLHVDWKFGAGVPVLASREDNLDLSDAERGFHINDQLMFYVTSCRSAIPKIYKGRRIAAAIVQPRADVMLSYVEILDADIRHFRKVVERAVDAALLPQPARVKGEHCRWAPCKATCPLWTGPMLDLTSIGITRPSSPARTVTPYGDYLSKAKDLVDMLAMFKKEIDDQLHKYLEDGGIVPGFYLKEQVKKRQWIDADIVAEELTKIGFSLPEIYAEKLVTFAQADATAKRLGVKIPDELRVAPVTNETTVARDGDPAPAVDRVQLTDQLRLSLRKLTTGA